MFPTPLKAQENSKMDIEEEEKDNKSEDSEMKDEFAIIIPFFYTF